MQITVKGNVGTARTAEGRLVPSDSGDYLASLDQLSGPYLLSNTQNSPSSLTLYSVATRPGIANLTPLTTLLVAQLLGEEPGAYYTALGFRGGFTAADDASIAVAEQRVRRYLKREFDFDVPAGIGNFVTTPFARVSGNLMFDTINALVARIGTGGDYGAVVTAIAQESARCKVESLNVSTGSTVDQFCPFAKANQPDPDDATISVISFTNRHGDVLTLRLRGAVLLGIRLVTAEGVTSVCGGAACTGVTVGTPAGDQTQAIGFAATPLSGADGGVALSGSLRTSAPGITLPGLPCTSNFFYLIDEVAGSAVGYCATPDAFGIGASGQSFPSGATRRRYAFSDDAGGPYLEVVTQGSTVVRALVYTIDPTTGASTPRFQCRDSTCPGVTLGAQTVDNSLGVPIVLQPIRFDRAVLAAVLPDGSLSTTDSVTIEATITGYFVDDPSALPFVPVTCSGAAPTVLALPSDQAQTIPVCEPVDTQGFTLRSSSLDGDGNTVYSVASLLTDGASVTVANSITLTVTPGGVLNSTIFDQFDGPRYQCVGAACSGIVIAAPNGLGERTITFSATALQELGTAGLAADRTATLNGSAVAPPLPP